MTKSVIAFVGLGGNLGETEATLRAALKALDAVPETRLLRASRLYRTPAWGMEQQPDFINAVAMLETRLDAQLLLESLFAIERRHGRVREAELRWGPRTLDLDLLLYGDALIDEPGLRVPHPHLHERAFALLPMLEIAADVEIPGLGLAQNAASLLEKSNIQPL
jgi:2-amino-4-hydroxy-6-hydroxymethyldihydropteridine diphosphokinase